MHPVINDAQDWRMKCNKHRNGARKPLITRARTEAVRAYRSEAGMTASQRAVSLTKTRAASSTWRKVGALGMEAAF
jgi:hypothetical protein